LNDEEIVLKRQKNVLFETKWHDKIDDQVLIPFCPNTQLLCKLENYSSWFSCVCFFWCENCQLLETESVILIGGWSCLKLKQLNPPH
jgi:hypothetical protein